MIITTTLLLRRFLIYLPVSNIRFVSGSILSSTNLSNNFFAFSTLGPVMRNKDASRTAYAKSILQNAKYVHEKFKRKNIFLSVTVKYLKSKKEKKYLFLLYLKLKDNQIYLLIWKFSWYENQNACGLN